jgi:hypothetical protein
MRQAGAHFIPEFRAGRQAQRAAHHGRRLRGREEEAQGGGRKLQAKRFGQRECAGQFA